MRQTGFIAACAAYALTHNFPQLSRVHELAKRLEVGLAELGVGVTGRAETSMVLYNPTTIGVQYAEVRQRCKELPEPITMANERLVLHFQTTEQAVEDLIAVVKQLKEEKKGSKDQVSQTNKATPNGGYYYTTTPQ